MLISHRWWSPARTGGPGEALPERADELAKKRYQERKTGSAFTGGSKIGVTIEQLYTAESR